MQLRAIIGSLEGEGFKDVQAAKRPRWRAGVLDRAGCPDPVENCIAPQSRPSCGPPPAWWRLRWSESFSAPADAPAGPSQGPKRPVVRKSLKRRSAVPTRQSSRLAEVRQGRRRTSTERRREDAESWRASGVVLKTVRSRR